LGGILLQEVPIFDPYIKDYDQIPGSSPLEWVSQFELENWGFFLVNEDSKPVAAAAVAHNTNGVNMLEERIDLSVLWDIRVDPEKRGRGIGKALFKKTLEWSAGRGCKQMKIETQNINSAACHFYTKMGCELGIINRNAYWQYPNIAHEVMLNWYIDL